MDREVRRLRDMLARKFSDACYNGFWFSPEMDFLLNAMKKSQEVKYIADDHVHVVAVIDL